MKKPLCTIIVVVLGLSLLPFVAQICGAADPLVFQGSLSYLGAFRVPQLGSAGDLNSFDYG